jgi:hypothetical protein
MNKENYLQGFNDYKKGVFEMIEENLMDALQLNYARMLIGGFYEKANEAEEGWIDYDDWWSQGIKFDTVSTYNAPIFRENVAKWWNHWQTDKFFQQVLDMGVGLDPKIVWDEVNQLVFDCIWKVAGYGNLWGHNNFMNWNINEPWEVKS